MRIILVAILLLCSQLSFADGDEIPKKAKKLFEKALQEIREGNEKGAIPYFNKAVDAYPKYTEAWARLGELHMKLYDYKAAKKAYSAILGYTESPASLFMVNWKLGDLCLVEEEYNCAVDHYKACAEMKTPPNWKDRKIRVKALLDQSQFAKNLVDNPVPFQPVPLDSTINSEHDEYLPMITADENTMVFTRRIGGKHGIEDFFMSYRDTSANWQNALDMAHPINTDANEGAICISADGKRLFFAAKDRKESAGGFDLYYCIKRGEEWEGPYNIGEPINTRYWDSQPSISADGRYLYFASRRKGGFGGIDIWVSYLNDDFYWEAPVNLGPSVNTTGDEQTPFIHADGETLYFASTGHQGMGDSDLFVVKKDEEGKWSKAKNLGYPINTPKNESGLIVSPDGRRAYYTAYVTGNGLDIHSFELPEPVKPKNYVTYVKGIVVDAETEEFLQAGVEVIDLETGEPYIKTISDPVNGEFLVTLPAGKNYLYNVVKKDYLFHSENFSLTDRNAKEPYEIKVALIPVLKPIAEKVEPKPAPKPEPIPEPVPAPKPVVVEPPKPAPVIIREEPKVIIPEPIPESKPEPVIIAPEPEPIPEPVKVVEPPPTDDYNFNTGESVVMKNVFFETNSFELKSASFYELNRLVDLLKAHPAMRIEIGGHTDSTGSKDYNLSLSEKRAKAVYQYLLERGISSSRLTFKGYGDNQPIFDNDTEFGRSQNRRTEFKIL